MSCARYSLTLAVGKVFVWSLATKFEVKIIIVCSLNARKNKVVVIIYLCFFSLQTNIISKRAFRGIVRYSNEIKPISSNYLFENPLVMLQELGMERFLINGSQSVKGVSKLEISPRKGVRAGLNIKHNMTTRESFYL